VQAYNSYGDSTISEAGNGAIIYTYPDAPINLVLNPAFVRTSTSLSIAWSEGAANGGSAVTSYRVYYDQANGNWVELVSGVTALTLTQSGLAFGLIYQFKIEAKTDYGYSEMSTVLSLLCAA
jgi:hypothetical protein